MTDPISEELILRYVTGKLSGDAAAQVRAYLDKTAKGRAVGIGLRQVMAAEVLERGSPDVQESLAELLNRLDRGSTVDVRSVVPTKLSKPWHDALGRQPLRWGIWSVTAMIMLGVAELVIGKPFEARPHEKMLAGLIYTTANGERATVTLPDGGTVMLNVASRLEVPVDYRDGNHTVRLVGEGLFTVPHRQGTPLTVLAGGTTARVLGTSFVVRRYARDTATLVSVREGKVAVGTVIVTASHSAMVGRTGLLRLGSSDDSPFTFATGVLTLNGVPLSDAIIELDRWYDADIRVGGSLATTHLLQGEFTAGSLTDLADILEHTLDMRVVRDGHVLTLYPR